MVVGNQHKQTDGLVLRSAAQQRVSKDEWGRSPVQQNWRYDGSVGDARIRPQRGTQPLVLRDARFASSSGRGRVLPATKVTACCLLLCLSLLAACAPASDYRPAVELSGIDTARYE